ncbi:H-NS family nucleoid-associated regulatory protein [Sulfitobacter sp. JB4-11]|uniref:H-NS histone family protein n=1 Tax=Sulfitobacter rhodophyticola TaxID=3238304 RepID=UPI003517A872
MAQDLKTMSAKELEKLLTEVKKALQNAQARDRRKARKAAERAAAEFGFSLDDLSEDAPKQRRKSKKAVVKSKPKFANPADKKMTWTGKGRQPNWYRAAVEKGVSPDDMKI